MVVKIPLLFLLAGVCLAYGCSRRSIEDRAEGNVSGVLDSIVKRSELTLVFSGDVMQHMPQVEAARETDGTYNYLPCFQYIRPLWESADFTVVNLETTLAEDGARYSGYPCFASPKSLAAALKISGVDVAALANNHCCDRGAPGIRTTVETLDSLGLGHVGVYSDSSEVSKRPLMLTKGRYKVALLNYTYGTNGMPVPRGMVVNRMDTVVIAEQVAVARRDSATHVVVFLHWGEEYQRHPNREQRELAAWCQVQGMDVVVGSHPHVAQPIDTVAGVVWSLGNFVSNQRGRYQDGGLSVRITLLMDEKPKIEFIPHWVWMPIRDDGRRAYYVVPAFVGGREIGMDSLTNRKFMGALEDNRQVVGEANEWVM